MHAPPGQLVVAINPIWKHTLNEFIQANGPEKCRKYGQWFANRFKDNPRVIYFIGGNRTPEPVRAELDEMGKGIQDVYSGKAMIAYHSEADQSSLEACPDASWITLNWTHAYSPEMPGALKESDTKTMMGRPGKHVHFTEAVKIWAF